MSLAQIGTASGLGGLQEGSRDQFFKDTTGLEVRNAPIDPAQRTLVIFHAGQSQRANIVPTLYIPTHSSRIDNFNVDDGQLYEIKGPMLGASYPDPPARPGNISARIADLVIERGIADRVISVPLAVGSTIKDWSRDRLANRLPVAVQRLAERAIVPSQHVRFIVDWSQGPSDTLIETAGAVWKEEFLKVVANTEAAGFRGIWYVSTDTWLMGTTAPMIAAAQAEVCDNVKIVKGFDSDSLGKSYRKDSAGHFNDTGAAIVADGVVDLIQDRIWLIRHSE